MTAPGRRLDVVVVGAGPAGLAAAATAGAAGASVALVDNGSGPGGQYWRGAADPRSAERGHHDLATFRSLWSAVGAAGVQTLFGREVVVLTGRAPHWRLDLWAADRSASERLEAAALVVATGAYDRQLPFPGWDLPGVMAAGGVQAMLKEHGVLAGRKVVIAGTGPFLLSVAESVIAADGQVAAVVEAAAPGAYLRRPGAALAGGKLGQAAGLAITLARSRTPYLTRRAVVRAMSGSDSAGVHAVEVAALDHAGRPRRSSVRVVDCDLLAVGWGFTPRLEICLQAGCAVSLGADNSLVVTVDDRQATSIAGLYAAGEITGVGGADLAVAEGHIAGASAVGITAASGPRRRRARLRRFAAAMHRVHRPAAFLYDAPSPDTVVCRCEEVTAGTLAEAVDDWGATDPRTVKLLTRAGMGWCQGRVCGSAVAELTARRTGQALSVADHRGLAERPFAAPVPLAALAALPIEKPAAPPIENEKSATP